MSTKGNTDDGGGRLRVAGVALPPTPPLIASMMSNVDIKAELGRALDDALRVFRDLWDEIGIGPVQCAERVDVIVHHMSNLLAEMVSEERALRDKLLRNIESYRAEFARLSLELHQMPTPEIAGPGKTTILQLEKELRLQVDALAAEKADRLQLLERLRDADQQLCDSLSTTPFYIPTGSVPTREQLDQLDAHVMSLRQIKEERLKKFLADRTAIIGLYEELGHEPSTTFEQDVAIEDPECFVLSNDNMDALDVLHEQLIRQQHERLALDRDLRERLTTLWQRLELPAADLDNLMSRHSGHRLSDIEVLQSEMKKCQQLKLQQVQRFVESIRTDLQHWWTKCYFSDKQRAAFSDFVSEHYTEELLQSHEAELERVREYYEANKEMLLKVERRAELWNRMLEFDAKERDPARYNNRGGGLLKEEKERKRILRELPKVEGQLKSAVEAWEAAQGRDFLCNGVKFTDFCRQQWEDYHRRKDEEKLERQKKSKENSGAEGMHGGGGRPTATPCKRPLNGGHTAALTPSSKVTPAKVRKLNEPTTPQTPLTITRIAHKSVFASPAPVSLPLKGHQYSASTTKLNDLASRTPGPTVATCRTPKSSTTESRVPRTRAAATAATDSGTRVPPQQPSHQQQEADSKGTKKVLCEKQSTDELAAAASPLSYHEFKVGLDEQSKQNWRSSELPQRP